MKLPLEFLEKIKSLLDSDEYTEFLESYNKPRIYGLRVNSLKISVEDFLKISPFSLKPIPWTKDGFYYEEGETPGRHPYYHAGLYYIQEPSAMLPGEVLDAQSGETVLDLCAAPGGKTVQLASDMRGQGLLIANDNNSERVRALVRNIERCGVRNAIVTNETPERLAVNFKYYFDKILVDVPCSGEGMFRKDEEAAGSWQNFKCEKCAEMQWSILLEVDKMLKPGGSIVYSTCTFSPEEDEKMISRFLQEFPGYEIIEMPKIGGIENGRPQWSDGNAELLKTARLWPHKVEGEGHFVALLRKKINNMQLQSVHNNRGSSQKDGVQEVFRAFEKENFNISINDFLETKGNFLYALPVKFPDLSGLKIAKFGWYLGELLRGKFEPSHSMMISLNREDIKNIINFSSGSKEVSSYLKGETLMIEGQKGLVGIAVDGYTLGWAKQTGDMLKNLYPKGWRKLS